MKALGVQSGVERAFIETVEAGECIEGVRVVIAQRAAEEVVAAETALLGNLDLDGACVLGAAGFADVVDNSGNGARPEQVGNAAAYKLNTFDTEVVPDVNIER